MARTARVTPKEYIYHILTRGNNRQDIFRDDEYFKKYIELLLRYKEKYVFKLYHYVLMSNHVHLVLETTGKGGTLSEIMKGINLSYAQHYKRRYRHIGHFWQDRYKSILISKDKYLLACGSYVELNPVRAGIVENPKNYRWSSYNAYAYGKTDRVVSEHLIYSELSDDEDERMKKYRDVVKGMLRERSAMRGEMDRRGVYGGEDFLKRVESEYGLSAMISRVGRPKKNENGDNYNRPRFSIFRVSGGHDCFMKGENDMRCKKPAVLFIISLIIFLLSSALSYADWSNVPPPAVSTNWQLNGVSFTSSGDGWAVGTDNTNFRGVLLHYSGGTWSNVLPPAVSANWGLKGVSFTSSGDGWAVGTDSTNSIGVLLHYSGGTWSNVLPPAVSANWELTGVSFQLFRRWLGRWSG
jgi:putative transposase